jgi:hypothetical protein
MMDKQIKLEIEAIRDVLMTADAVSCDVDFYEPVHCFDNTIYHIPHGYCVQIDYNKLAQAIYNAGYRKGEKDVRYIRAVYKKGNLEYGSSALGRKFGVDHKAIHSVATGKTWRHIK